MRRGRVDRMAPLELDDLDRCILCGHPVRRPIEIENVDGEVGMACRACLRRSRRTADERPK